MNSQTAALQGELTAESPMPISPHRALIRRPMLRSREKWTTYLNSAVRFLLASEVERNASRLGILDTNARKATLAPIRVLPALKTKNLSSLNTR